MLMQRIVIALAVLYVLTFLGGFLQATPLNFLNYISFSLLLVGGVSLVAVAMKSEAIGVTWGSLILTGISTALLALLFVGYEWSRLKGKPDLEPSIAVDLVLLRRTGAANL